MWLPNADPWRREVALTSRCRTRTSTSPVVVLTSPQRHLVFLFTRTCIAINVEDRGDVDAYDFTLISDGVDLQTIFLVQSNDPCLSYLPLTLQFLAYLAPTSTSRQTVRCSHWLSLNQSDNFSRYLVWRTIGCLWREINSTLAPARTTSKNSLPMSFWDHHSDSGCFKQLPCIMTAQGFYRNTNARTLRALWIRFWDHKSAGHPPWSMSA